MAIDSIIQATVLSNAEEQICIKLKTSNLDDYIKMRENINWPKTIFGSKTGVYVRIIHSELPLSITGIDKKKTFDPKMIKNLMKVEQISNIERQWYNGGEFPAATNKVNFTANNLKAFVDTQKKGFFFIDGVKYKAEPQINHSNCCNNCGDLKHGKKFCKNRTRCMKCSETGHSEVDCKTTYEFCYRCQNKSHRCDTDKCEVVADKTFELNKFVLTILIGEQIIVSRFEILRNRTANNTQNLNIDLIQNMIDATLDAKITPRLDQNETKIKDIDSKLNSMCKNIDEIKTSNQVQSVKLDNLTTGIPKLLELATKNPLNH